MKNEGEKKKDEKKKNMRPVWIEHTTFRYRI